MNQRNEKIEVSGALSGRTWQAFMFECDYQVFAGWACLWTFLARGCEDTLESIERARTSARLFQREDKTSERMISPSSVDYVKALHCCFRASLFVGEEKRR